MYKKYPRSTARGGICPGINELYPAFIHFEKHLFYEHFILSCQGDVIDSSKDHIRVDVLLLVLGAYGERFCKDKVKLP